jgi:hypothetical protein
VALAHAGGGHSGIIGLPEKNTWANNQYRRYIMQMIKKGDDN